MATYQCNTLLGAPPKTVLFRDGGVSRVLTAFGAHKLGALRAVCPHVFAHTMRFSARAFLALTKNAWFLVVPLRVISGLPVPNTSDLFYYLQPKLGQIRQRLEGFLCQFLWLLNDLPRSICRWSID
jgi:hypothetical protein